MAWRRNEPWHKQPRYWPSRGEYPAFSSNRIKVHIHVTSFKIICFDAESGTWREFIRIIFLDIGRIHWFTILLLFMCIHVLPKSILSQSSPSNDITGSLLFQIMTSVLGPHLLTEINRDCGVDNGLSRWILWDVIMAGMLHPPHPLCFDNSSMPTLQSWFT